MNGPGTGSAGGLVWQRDNGLLVGLVSLFFSFLVSFGDWFVVDFGCGFVFWCSEICFASIKPTKRTLTPITFSTSYPASRIFPSLLTP